MILQSFRIQNFRSIVDTGWCPFSQDNVTVLVGQNESGKTSILSALALIFGNGELTEDDIRTTQSSQELPKVSIKFYLSKDKIENFFKNDYLNSEAFRLCEILKKINYLFETEFTWDKSQNNSFEEKYKLVLKEEIRQELDNFYSDVRPSPNALEEAVVAQEPAEERVDQQTKQITSEVLAGCLYDSFPKVVLFNRNTGVLPDSIDIIDNSKLESKLGAAAVRNFLKYANIDLPTLLSQNNKAQETILKLANDKISEQFSDFWTQRIGRKNKIRIECKLYRYGSENAEKVGKPFLSFYFYDGDAFLHLRQRSDGVKWFFSFFLQLKAIEDNPDKIFLLDEPGSNLHIKAQEDVLKLMNEISGKVPLVYSTHNPDMIEQEKLYRILAVERAEVEEIESPTIVKTATQLSSASQDTLSPILRCMGANFYNQNIIQKTNNVLLEEISAFYYIKAFYKLENKTFPMHLVPCTGVTNVVQIANILFGWGVKFIVVIDDDTSGRDVFKTLKRNFHHDDDATANKYLYKIDSCSGIEDIFDPIDFAKYVIGDESIVISGKVSAFVKSQSKPIIAAQFLKLVMDGQLSFDALQSSTQSKISVLLNQIETMLENI